MSIKIGSLFAGIGGFELGCERAWPNSETIWQVEQNPYCQSILSKHWPKAKIYNDVRDITINNVEPVDVLLGGFPCQDISVAGQQKGVHDGKKSSLWWEMHRIIGELRPRVIIMENVSNILRLGGADVIGSLAQIGYDCEWTVIRASDFGACHQRARWFCVAYPNGLGPNQTSIRRTPPVALSRGTVQQRTPQTKNAPNNNGLGPNQTSKNKSMRSKSPREGIWVDTSSGSICGSISNTNSPRAKTISELSERVEEMGKPQNGDSFGRSSLFEAGDNSRSSDWERCEIEPIICGVDDGISNWMDRDTKRQHNQRLMALGNAIVPQCSQWIAEQVLQSGLLDDLLEGK